MYHYPLLINWKITTTQRKVKQNSCIRINLLEAPKTGFEKRMSAFNRKMTKIRKDPEFC